MSVSISGAGSISGLDQGFNVTSGNVGISTDNPTEKLEVLGSTLLKGTSSTATALKIRGAGTQGDDATISFTNGYTQTFKIGMSDDIGPARDFIISETSTGSSSDNENPKYIFNGNGDGIFQITDRAGGDVNVQLATNGISYLTGGNFGIGDITPDNTLSIKGIGSFDGDSNSFYFGSNFTGTGQNYIGSSKHAQRFFLNNASANGYFSYSNTGSAGTAGNAITWQERFRITSAGTIKCGTSATLKAEINNSVSGHQFISQCSDNNNGFEVYQQHASNTTRNNFAVYANTGSGNAKNLQFAVRGDGAVTKPGQPLAVIGTTQNNLTPSTGSIIQFDYAATNRGNHYNTTNYTFTCPVAGDYMVILRHSRKGWCGDLDLQKNGTTHAYLELRETGLNGAGTPAPDWQAGSYSFIVPCAANDVLRWRVGATYTATGSGGYLLDGFNHIKYDAVTYYLIG